MDRFRCEFFHKKASFLAVVLTMFGSYQQSSVLNSDYSEITQLSACVGGFHYFIYFSSYKKNQRSSVRHNINDNHEILSLN